jgi:hypothetical protein
VRRVASTSSRTFFDASPYFVCSTKKCGEDAPETADLYFSYGKALLENAISQSGVLGKDKDKQEEGAEEPGASLLTFVLKTVTE